MTNDYNKHLDIIIQACHHFSMTVYGCVNHDKEKIYCDKVHDINIKHVLKPFINITRYNAM